MGESVRHRMVSFNTLFNDSVHEAPCFRDDSSLARAFRIAPFLPITFFALTGNPLVLAVIYKAKTMRKTINFFIANMALSDLIFTVVYIPRVVTILLFGYKWLMYDLAGLIFCKAVPFTMEVTIIVSVLTIVFISFDRFLAVNFPLRTLITTKICAFLICISWLSAAVVRIPTLIATEFEEYNGDVYCLLDMDETFGSGSGRIYFRSVFIALYALPFSVILVLNTAIVVVMRKRKQPGNISSEAFIRRKEEINRKVLRMVLVVVGAFLICWSLYFVLMVLRQNDVHVSCDVLYIRLVLVHFNAALTPWIYAILSENYRRGFEEILSKIGCKMFAIPREAESASIWQNSTSRDSQLGVQLQNLKISQYGSTAQLLN